MQIILSLIFSYNTAKWASIVKRKLFKRWEKDFWSMKSKWWVRSRYRGLQEVEAIEI